jgi:hypothetical protein
VNSTTQRVYRYLYKQGGKPVGVHEVQNGLALSSASLAHYHIRKLVDEGLAKEEAGGYVVDKIIFENMIRIRRSVIPFQTTYLAIFLSTFILMLAVFRPQQISGAYIFALLVNAMALGIFAYETVKALRQK